MGISRTRWIFSCLNILDWGLCSSESTLPPGLLSLHLPCMKAAVERTRGCQRCAGHSGHAISACCCRAEDMFRDHRIGLAIKVTCDPTEVQRLYLCRTCAPLSLVSTPTCPGRFYWYVHTRLRLVVSKEQGRRMHAVASARRVTSHPMPGHTKEQGRRMHAMASARRVISYPMPGHMAQFRTEHML